MSAHRYNTRFQERGEESPLSTRELRDRLVRRRVSEYNDDDEERELQISRQRSEAAKLRAEAAETLEPPPPKRTPSAATKQTMTTSPPSKGFLMSSPAEVTVATMPSPQVSRIEDRGSPPSPGSAVTELEKIRRSMTSSSSPTLALNRSSTSTKSSNRSSTTDVVDSDRGQPSEVERSLQTPKRQSPRPIKRTLSMESDVGSSKSSLSCGSFLKSALFITVLAAVVIQFLPLEQRFHLNQLFVDDTLMNTTLSRDNFFEDLRSIRRDLFPSQDKKTWTVIGASVKSVFTQNKTMPACVLLIGNTKSGQQTANCLASRLADSFHKSILPRSVEDLTPLDAGSLTELNRDEAKRRLFDTLREKLKIDHTLTLLNIQKLSGDVAMALHAFCDEGSEAANFPLSTLFMTIENTHQTEIVTTSTESLADALLHSAWLSDIGIDKVSSLISRVAVSVAKVAPEPKMVEACF